MHFLKSLLTVVFGIIIGYPMIVLCLMTLLYGRYWYSYERSWDTYDKFWPWNWVRRRKGEGTMPMKTVTIYTDGACSGNPGPGGWGAILEFKGTEKELSGGEAQTTNNRMELMGVISALEALKEPCRVELYSDSKYVIDALTKGWAQNWQRNGWRKADKKPALNIDLWERLLSLCQRHEVICHWVKGHAENPKNNRCDQLAVAESQKYK